MFRLVTSPNIVYVGCRLFNENVELALRSYEFGAVMLLSKRNKQKSCVMGFPTFKSQKATKD